MQGLSLLRPQRTSRLTGPQGRVRAPQWVPCSRLVRLLSLRRSGTFARSVEQHVLPVFRGLLHTETMEELQTELRREFARMRSTDAKRPRCIPTPPGSCLTRPEPGPAQCNRHSSCRSAAALQHHPDIMAIASIEITPIIHPRSTVCLSPLRGLWQIPWSSLVMLESESCRTEIQGRGLLRLANRVCGILDGRRTS